MDIYAIVTEKIVNLLESGVVQWRRPWASTGLPRNLVSKKPSKKSRGWRTYAEAFMLAVPNSSHLWLAD